ncbi:MAG: hypothetical protein WBB67_11905 [bacterium]
MAVEGSIFVRIYKGFQVTNRKNVGEGDEGNNLNKIMRGGNYGVGSENER